MAYEEIEYTKEEYEEHLNEAFGEVEVCGLTYNAGHLLKEIDDTAFRCGFNDWESSQPQYKCCECDTTHEDEDEAKECCLEDEE